ncbi:hypothetical protein EGH24_08560 [Halonotius terrestris]|uniref:Uncharacterized protein n=1 Tax=Halonotius terrestris TaxID=2487750 RepID=A0A8J8TCN2_9EURY|nr:hypothetical protein [Halonotius terrestris]TQQ81174.1 hypothetical protein EGH24_08560 [Halonotius terrestris]
MGTPIRRVLIGDDTALTVRILRIAALLSLAAVGPVVGPELWAWADLAGGETVRFVAAGGFLLAVLAASYALADAGDLQPTLPIAAVGVVLAGSWVTGRVTEAELVFLLGPALMLGVVAALAAYANNGAIPALSLVFVPVFAYVINAPGGLPAGLPFGTRLRLSLLFGLLFTFSIGSAGFLVGSWVRWLLAYAELQEEGLLDPIDDLGGLVESVDSIEDLEDIDDLDDIK